MSDALKAGAVTVIGTLMVLNIFPSEPSEATRVASDTVIPASSCHPSYSGCLEINAGDYDCADGSGNGPNYTGTVRVHGSDPFDLDRDNDGWGCE